MRYVRLKILLVIALQFLLLSPINMAQANSDLETKIASVLPTAQEDAWLNVGWNTNLMAARRQAQALHRPLFLWVMNGHPLGCT